MSLGSSIHHRSINYSSRKQSSRHWSSGNLLIDRIDFLPILVTVITLFTFKTFLMRKIYLSRAVAIALAVTLSIGCQKEFKDSDASQQYKAMLVDSLDAVAIARHITPVNMFFPDQPDANRKIESGIAVRDERNNPAYYVFSFVDSGFIVIAADRQLEPILAFSESSKLKPGKVAPGMYNWLQKTQEAVEILRKGWYDNTDAAAKEWAFIDQRLANGQSGISTRTLRPPPDEPCSPTKYYEVGPLLPVTWGQGCTYNSQCPPDVNGPCSFTVTGCVATAMAQVMAFYQRPTSYNWAGMPANIGNAEVARLMRDAGNSVNMQYSATGSGAYHWDIDDALKNTFGYSIANDVGYNKSQVLGNIQINHPVILSGFNGTFTSGRWLWETTHYIDGHEWVCDGYRMWTNPCQTTVFMHMNWGWHEQFTTNDQSGWFRDVDWTIHAPGGDLHFQYNKRAIVDIIP